MKNVLRLLSSFCLVVSLGGALAQGQESSLLNQPLIIPVLNSKYPKLTSEHKAILAQMVRELHEHATYRIAIRGSFSDLKWRGFRIDVSNALNGAIATGRTGDIVNELVTQGLTKQEEDLRVGFLPLRGQMKGKGKFDEPFVEVSLVDDVYLKNAVAEIVNEAVAEAMKSQASGAVSTITILPHNERILVNADDQEILKAWVDGVNAAPDARVLVTTSSGALYSDISSLFQGPLGLQNGLTPLPYTVMGDPSDQPVVISATRILGEPSVTEPLRWTGPDAHFSIVNGVSHVNRPETISALQQKLAADPLSGLTIHVASSKDAPMTEDELKNLLHQAGLTDEDLARATFLTLPPVDRGFNPYVEIYQGRNTVGKPLVGGPNRGSNPTGDANGERRGQIEFPIGASVSVGRGWDDHRTPGYGRTNAFTTLDAGVRWNGIAGFAVSFQIPGAFFENDGGNLRIAKYELIVPVLRHLAVTISREQLISRQEKRDPAYTSRTLVAREKALGLGLGAKYTLPVKKFFEVSGGVTYYVADRVYILPAGGPNPYSTIEDKNKKQFNVYLSFDVLLGKFSRSLKK